MEGKIISKKSRGNSAGEIEKVLKSMEGEIELTVPIYSALKLKGRPFYSYAREGFLLICRKEKRKFSD